jgi:aryl-alcohol dehydrogenase-like predicted oxidoreductase
MNYLGISDTPAWIVSQANAIALLSGWSPFVATQIEYNLASRTPERELIPMSHALDLAILAWSPLAMGIFPHEFLPTQRDIIFGGFYDEIINHRKSRSGETETGKEYHVDPSRIGN